MVGGNQAGLVVNWVDHIEGDVFHRFTVWVGHGDLTPILWQGVETAAGQGDVGAAGGSSVIWPNSINV